MKTEAAKATLRSVIKTQFNFVMTLVCYSVMDECTIVFPPVFVELVSKNVIWALLDPLRP